MARTGGAGRDSSSDASGRLAAGGGAGKDGQVKGRAERPAEVQVDEAMDADSDGANRNETAEGGNSHAMEEEEAGGENQDPSGADAAGGETQPTSAKDKRTVTSPAWDPPHLPGHQPAFSSLLLSSLELSDTKVYEPYIRALLGTASQFC